jgi:ribosome-associated translation inhibitor RaiA
MVVEGLDSKIVLERFDCLDEQEIITAKKLVQKYVQKIEKISDYKKIKLEIKVHPKNNSRHFEVKGHLDYDGGMVTSEDQDSSPFVAIDKVLGNLLKEIQHKVRKN